MPPDYVAPERGSDAFNCPYPACGAFAHQTWPVPLAQDAGLIRPYSPEFALSLCGRCGQTTVWLGQSIVYPPALVAPPPHEDLGEPALATYIEARSVLAASPRAAAALLRLCLQQLLPMLGATNGNLNAAVGELVALGLPPRIQQAMDAVRLIGNEAVHPGEIDVNEDPAMTLALFDLVNLTVDAMVTQPNAVNSVYNKLPQSKRDAIEQRDQGA